MLVSGLPGRERVVNIGAEGWSTISTDESDRPLIGAVDPALVRPDRTTRGEGLGGERDTDRELVLNMC